MPDANDINKWRHRLTIDPDETDHAYHYSLEIQEKLRQTYREVQKAKPRYLTKLLKLVDRYSKIPAFKNYLVTYYRLRHKPEKAFALNRQIVEEFPDYLHGKLVLASEYMDKGQFAEVPGLLGETLDLQAHYPERKRFHVNEFESFYTIVCEYQIGIEDLEAAEETIDFIKKVMPESESIVQLGRLLTDKRHELSRAIWKKSLERREAQPEKKGYKLEVQTDQPPQLNHPELAVLYQKSLTIEPELIRSILALPRETLVTDLASIFWDSVCRFEYFQSVVEATDWDEDKLSFPLHALLFLTELKAYEQLPLMLEGLRQGEDYLEFWYSDHTFETLWHFIYHLGQEQLPLLQKFMREPDLFYAGKVMVSQAMVQIGLHHTERQAEMAKWYEELLQYFLDHLDDEHLIDYAVIAPIVVDFSHLPTSWSQRSLIRQFFELDLVDISYSGDFEELAAYYFDQDRSQGRYDVHDSIFDHYQRIVAFWYGDDSEEVFPEDGVLFPKDDDKAISRLAGKANPAATSQPEWGKVGRNDPCLCGSGKKFKKCCWNIS